MKVPPGRCVGVPLRGFLAFVMSVSVRGAGFREDFTTDPAERGWRAFGDRSLFHWDLERGALGVTWDSSHPNSYYALALPASLTKADDFGFGFTLQLDAYEAGFNPDKPGTFQIAFGLLNLAQATAEGFERGVLLRTTNLVEWTWFGGAAGISPSVSPVVVPRDGRLPWGYRDSFVSLETGVRYSFQLNFVAAVRQLQLAMTVDGHAGPELQSVTLPATFTDFRVDALSINSYSDAGQNPVFAGSVRARGWIDEVTWNLPEPPVTTVHFTAIGGAPGVTTTTHPGWIYQLESSGDLQNWADAGKAVEGTGGEVGLPDSDSPEGRARYYRVRASRP